MSSFATEARALERARPFPARIRAAARGAALGALSRLPRESGPGVRIVHYHYVFDDERERFAEQLGFLTREFRPVSLSQAVERRLGRSIARRPKQGFDPPVERWLRTDLRELAGDAVASLDGLVDRRLAERATPAQTYALTMLSLWRTGLESRARELVRH